MVLELVLLHTNEYAFIKRDTEDFTQDVKTLYEVKATQTVVVLIETQ